MRACAPCAPAVHACAARAPASSLRAFSARCLRARHSAVLRPARVAAAVRVTAAVEVAAAPDKQQLERLRFLTPEDAEAVRQKFGTPAYVYDVATLKQQARQSAP